MLRATSPVFVCEPLEGRALLSVATAAVHHPHHHRVVHHAKAVHPGPVTDPPIFVQISGITGESTDARHRGAIDVSQFALGASNPSDPLSSTAGKPVATPVSFQKAVDSTTPTLFDAMLRGRAIGRVVISVGDPNNPSRDVVRYAFSNVRISNDSITTAAAGTNAGTETVSFVYETEMITALNPSGVPVTQTFSFSQNPAA